MPSRDLPANRQGIVVLSARKFKGVLALFRFGLVASKTCRAGRNIPFIYVIRTPVRQVAGSGVTLVLNKTTRSCVLIFKQALFQV